MFKMNIDCQRRGAATVECCASLTHIYQQATPEQASVQAGLKLWLSRSQRLGLSFGSMFNYLLNVCRAYQRACLKAQTAGH